MYPKQNIEICRMYELDSVSSNAMKVCYHEILHIFLLKHIQLYDIIYFQKFVSYMILLNKFFLKLSIILAITFVKISCKIAGVHHWKHGKKGSGVFWLQQARDEVRLNRIAQQLFDFVGKSVSDESFKVSAILF